MKSLSLLLIALMLTSCATTTMPQYSSNAEYMAAHGIVPDDGPPPLVSAKSSVTDCDLLLPSCATFTSSQPATSTPPPAVQDSVSGWDVLAGIVALPLVIPIALLAGYPSYRASRTTCRSYVYKDQYHTTCY
jgi:hypothetical protein